MDKIKSLGKRALAAPFGIAILLFCVLGLAVAPMMHMAPKNMPIAIVNLDKGAELPTGETLVAGDLVEENIQELVDENADGDVPPMAFTSLASRTELDEGIADYYAAIVIPEDFTEKQLAGNMALAASLGEGLQDVMAAQQAAASDPTAIALLQANPEAAAELQQQAQAALASKMQVVVQDAIAAQQDADKPTVELVANTAKSPIFANTMQSSMTAKLAQAGVQVEVTTVGDAADDANPLSGILGVQMMVMPMMILSLIMSLLVFAITRIQDEERTRESKARTAGMQVGVSAAASLVAALAAYGIVAWCGGLQIPAQAIPLLWLASFCIMLANIGLLSVSIPLGALIMVCAFALGMGTAILPPEMLPQFWSDWVFPWAPQVAIGDGVRNIIYLGGGAFDVGVPRLLAWGCVGLVALVIGVLMPSKKSA